jgi:HAD superfamily hydrolase (TIGR01509 family)
MDETAAHESRGRQVVKAMAELGVNVTVMEWAATYEAAFMQAPNGMLEHAIVTLGLSKSEAAMVRGKTTFDRTLEVPYPGVIETITALSRRYRLGVIANQDPGLPERLRDAGMLRYFDIVLGSGDIGLSKPNHEIFKRALLLSGCLPEHAVMIGDRTGNDIVPAKAVGMKTIRVRQGFTRAIEASTEAERPDADVAAIADLTELLVR